MKIEATTVTGPTGKPKRMIGVDMDVTASIEAERTLREQAHLIQRTNEALPDILYVADISTKEILYINHSFEERLGYGTELRNQRHKNVLTLVYEEDLPGMLAHYEELKTAADGDVCEYEYRVRAADGSLHWFRDRNAVFKRNTAGVPIQKIGIAQDVTERKKAEQELKESNINLRYANENLQQFATIASHDLQEPLRKLTLFSNLLAKRYAASIPDEGRELIGKMGLTTERMRQLISEVLQYSKIAHDVNEFLPTDLDLIIQRLLSDLDLLLEEAGASIRYDQPLPVVSAIPPQINQLFYNLLTNAVNFRKKNEPLVISISSRQLSTAEAKTYTELKEGVLHVQIVVEDNGIGFEQQFSQQIFQIFERLHSVDEYEGTGVGLALCKKIVEIHFGHIYAVSEEGKGTAFYVILPVAH